MNIKEITRRILEVTERFKSGEGENTPKPCPNDKEVTATGRIVRKYPIGLTHIQMGTGIHNDLERAMRQGASFKQACAELNVPEPKDGGEDSSTVTGHVRSEEPNLMEIAKSNKFVRYNEADVDAAKKAMSLWEQEHGPAEPLCIPFNDLEVCVLGGGSNEHPLLSVRVPSVLADIDALEARILASLGVPKEFFNEMYPPVPKPPSLTSPRELAMSPCIGGGMVKDHPASFMPRPTPKPKKTRAEGTFTIHEEAANTDGARERLAYAKEMFRKYLVGGDAGRVLLERALMEKRLCLLSEMPNDCGAIFFSTSDNLHVPGLFVKFSVSSVAVNLCDAWEVLIEGLSR